MGAANTEGDGCEIRPNQIYVVTDKRKVGDVAGSAYLVHDDANASPKGPAYAVLKLHTSYQLIELFGLINNGLNQHLFDTFTGIGGFAPRTTIRSGC